MGLFKKSIDKVKDGFKQGFKKIADKVEERFKKLREWLNSSEFDKNDMKCQINAGAKLADFRSELQPDILSTETQCMDDLSELYDKIEELVKNRFSDLSELVQTRKKQAKEDLSGTIENYVKEHISENDEIVLTVLEMPPGDSRANAMKEQNKRVIRNAKRCFKRKLEKNARDISDEINRRLDIRIKENDDINTKRIRQLEELMEMEEKNQCIDVEKIINDCWPKLEAAQCTINILKSEVNL